VGAGLDFIEKKTGHTMGRDTNEKITDGARGLYEKATGYVSFFPIDIRGRRKEKESNLIQVLHTENKSTPSTRTNEMDSFTGRRSIRSGRIRWEWCLDGWTGLGREYGG